MVDVATGDLLIELGVEELPAGSVQSMADFLAAGMVKALNDAELKPSGFQMFATPRRIAVLLGQVPSMQQDRTVQKRGPAIAAAFDADNNPTKALQGFARSNGVSVDDLTRLKTDKGEWVVHESHQAGLSVAEVVESCLPQIIKQMPMPKRMRWSDGKDEFLQARWKVHRG